MDGTGRTRPCFQAVRRRYLFGGMARVAPSDAGSATPDLLVDLARRAGEAFNTREVSDLASLIHEDCEFHSAFGQIEGRVYRGPAETAAYVEDIDVMFDDWHLESEEFHPRRARASSPPTARSARQRRAGSRWTSRSRCSGRSRTGS